MTSTFTTYVEDDQGTEHAVVVHFRFTRPAASTHWQPAEGGPEIEYIVSPIRLTEKQQARVEQECVDYAWECWRERNV